MQNIKKRENRLNSKEWLDVINEEIAAMHATINEERAKKNLPAVLFQTVEKADSLAAGHIDYAKKFAFYCYEIIEHGDEWNA